LSVELFSSLNEARALSEDCRQDYKHDRLRCALGMTIPKPVRDRPLAVAKTGVIVRVRGPALLVGVRRGADLARYGASTGVRSSKSAQSRLFWGCAPLRARPPVSGHAVDAFPRPG
jgi:hypothetical protein